MLEGTLGTVRLHQCGKCFGLWLFTAVFEEVCRNSERQAAVLGTATPLTPQNKPLTPINYKRCPKCRQFMNRVNFARHSGVVVDVCRAHGTWFEMNELQQIVQFIRSGGLEAARAREVADLREERRRRESASLQVDRGSPVPEIRDLGMLSLIAGASRGLLDGLLDR